MQTRLDQAFRPDGLASRLGFAGFDNKSVVNLEAGDGRYSAMLPQLGASAITLVEKYQVFLERGKVKGWMVGEVICADVVDVANNPAYKGRYDCALITNLSPTKQVEPHPTLTAASRLLKPNGQLVVTLVERGRTPHIAEQMKAMFVNIEYGTLNKGELMPANNFMIVGSRR